MNNQSIYHVDRIIRGVGNGVTEPLFALISNGANGFEAVIKRKGNPQGLLVLVNELISLKIAQRLNLNIPNGGIALIDSHTEDSLQILSNNDFGYCFFSRKISRALPLNENIMKYINTGLDFERIILFDHLIYNTDRNNGNMLIGFSKMEKILYIIDHSHVFKNQTIWNKTCFEQGIKENDYLDDAIIERNGYYLFFASKEVSFSNLCQVALSFQKLLDKDFYQEVIYCLPPDWVIGKEDMVALHQYLEYRTAHLTDICKVIANFKRLKQ